MSNQIVRILHTFKPPKEDFINEESIGDLMQICPAVGAITQGGDAASSDINRGFLSAMGIIYDMIVGSGTEDCLTTITLAFSERVDKLILGGKFSLVRDGTPIIPAVTDIMIGKPTAFTRGILLALACVVKRAEEDFGPSDTVIAYDIPEPEPEPKNKPAAEQLPSTVDNDPLNSPNILKILTNLYALNIPLDRISLRPKKTDTDIELGVIIRLISPITLEKIEEINCALKGVLGTKEITINCDTGLWIQANL